MSDEEKNAIPEHVKKAAREMGLKAFKERLKEIQMSEYDAKVYNEYSSPVQSQVTVFLPISVFFVERVNVCINSIISLNRYKPYE